MVAYTCNHSTQEAENYPKFKASLSYTVSSRVAWATENPVFKKNKQTKTTTKKNPKQQKGNEKNFRINMQVNYVKFQLPKVQGKVIFQ